MIARTFPLRVAPVPGEAIDSWLEAIAHRHRVALGDVAVSLQLPWRQGSQWVWTLDAQQCADLSAATDIAQTAVQAMTLSNYDGERELIECDLDRLRAGGVTEVPSPAAAFERYRLFSAEAWDATAMTIAWPGLQAPENAEAAWRRACVAVEDLETAAAVDSLR